MAKLNLNDRLPANTLVYVGRRQLRHASEPNLKQEEMLEQAPQAYPHTFIDFSGVKLAEVLEHAGGKQGCVVDAQKVIRDKSTLAEVKAWRKSFTKELAEKLVEQAANLGDPEKAAVINDEEPYVVLNFKTAGSKLDVPKQPSDMLAAIKENATLVYEALLANLSEEEQLEKAPALYEQMIAMSS